MPKASILSSAARRVIVSINPNAGTRHRLDLMVRLQDALAEHGLEVTVAQTLDELRLLVQDRQLQPEIRAVVAGGGDGTVALVANLALPGTPVAILPLGTENLLSKYLHVPSDPHHVAKTIAEGLTVELDAGLAGERLFLLMAGVGFDAEVVRRLHEARRGNIHHLSYVKPILDAIRNYQYPEVRVYCRDAAGQKHELSAKWVFVVNVPRYAGGLAISPDAVADDGLLNVCTFKEGSLLSGLMYLSGIVLGQHTNWNDFVTHRASEVRIESAATVPYQLDGDPGGYLPVDVRILPKRLTLVVSRAWAKQYGIDEYYYGSSTHTQ